MFLNRLFPFFKLDGADGGWSDVFTAEAAKPEDGQPPAADPDEEDLESNTDPADEDQPEGESDADESDEEALEDDKPAVADDAEIDLGEGRQPVKFAELKQGYLRQSDYTKKTQALADERTAFEGERKAMEPTKQWHDYISANPWLFQQVNAAIKEFQNTGVLPLEDALADSQYGQYINHLMAENAKMKQELDGANGKLGEMEFSTTIGGAIAELKAEYGALITPEYEQELRTQAKTENLKPDMLKRIAKGDLAEQKLKQNSKKAKDIEADTIQKIQENRNALPSQPKSKGQKPSTPTKSVEDMSWSELLQG